MPLNMVSVNVGLDSERTGKKASMGTFFNGRAGPDSGCSGPSSFRFHQPDTTRLPELDDGTPQACNEEDNLGASSSEDEARLHTFDSNRAHQDPAVRSVVRFRDKTQTMRPPVTKIQQDSYWQRLGRDFPYFGALASLLCCVGGTMFAVETHGLEAETLMALQEVAHVSYFWLEPIFVALTASGSLLVALSCLVFFARMALTLANLRGARLAAASPDVSRIPHLVFWAMLYPALPIWTALTGFSAANAVLARVLLGVCQTEEVRRLWVTGPLYKGDQCLDLNAPAGGCSDCIDLYQFHFLFPASTRKEDMWICGEEVPLLCQKYLPPIGASWFNCAVASVLAVLGIGLHLASLTYTWTRIAEDRKARQLLDRAYISQHIKVEMRRSLDAAAVHLLCRDRDFT